MDTLHQRNLLVAKRLQKGLASRNMQGFICETAEEAKKLCLELISSDETVAFGGSKTAEALGLKEKLAAHGCKLVDGHDFADPREGFLASFASDSYICSSNAVSADGVLVNIDGNSNRVAALAYGPKQVIMPLSIKKVCPDLDTAISRARNVAAPANALRFNDKTPCTKTGLCANCKLQETVCCNFLITRFSRVKNRIKVLIILEDLGF